MSYFWLILIAFIVTWIVLWSLKLRIDALAVTAPLQYVYRFELIFTKHILDVLKLTAEEQAYLTPFMQSIFLTIEFWRGHLVVYLSTEGREQKPRPVYLHASYYAKRPLKIWEKRFAEGEDSMFDFHPSVPRLRLSLNRAIDGRFGRQEFSEPKPQNVFMNIPLSGPRLLARYYYRDPDPEAYLHWRGLVSEYKNFRCGY